MRTYEIYEVNGKFEVYERNDYYFILIKSFKTRKGAENWIARKTN